MSAPEVIVFPDVEQLLGDWLAEQFTARSIVVPFGTRTPSPRPTEFGRLIRTGGTVGNVFVLDNPTVTFEYWAQTETAAVSGVQLMRGLVNSLPGQVVDGVQIYRVDELGGPVNLPDPESAQVRYTFTSSILLRGVAA